MTNNDKRLIDGLARKYFNGKYEEPFNLIAEGYYNQKVLIEVEDKGSYKNYWLYVGNIAIRIQQHEFVLLRDKEGIPIQPVLKTKE